VSYELGDRVRVTAMGAKTLGIPADSEGQVIAPAPMGAHFVRFDNVSAAHGPVAAGVMGIQRGDFVAFPDEIEGAA
jgi:hypothetical protein